MTIQSLNVMLGSEAKNFVASVALVPYKHWYENVHNSAKSFFFKCPDCLTSILEQLLSISNLVSVCAVGLPLPRVLV